MANLFDALSGLFGTQRTPLLQALAPSGTPPATPTAAPEAQASGAPPSFLDGLGNFVSNNPGFFGALGSGIASGPTFAAGLSNAAQLLPAAEQQDTQLRLTNTNRNATFAALQKSNPDLAAAVAAGLPIADAWNEAMQRRDMATKPMAPVSVAPGGTLVDARTGKVLFNSDPSGGFYGTDLKSQAWNTVLKGQADPSARDTPQYRAAWAIATEPTMTPQGMMTPNVPSSWAPPDGNAVPPPAPNGAAPPAAPAPGTQPALPPPLAAGGTPVPLAPLPSPSPDAPASGLPMVAPPNVPTQGPGVIPGTQPFNESQSRATDLASMAIPDLATAVASYPALANPRDMALQALSNIDPTGIAHGQQSPEYQRAYSATRSVISNLLYTVSGAAIGDKELERKIDDLMPQLGDKPPVISDKMNRLGNYVMSIANATKDPLTIQRAAAAVSQIAAVQAKLQPPAQPGAPKRISNDADYNALPSGTQYIAPDGTTRTKR